MHLKLQENIKNKKRIITISTITQTINNKEQYQGQINVQEQRTTTNNDN